MVLIQGENGQGKSNLLEAIYILAIVKSPRTPTDRALIRRQAAHEETYTRVAALVRRDGEDLRVQIDLKGFPTPPEGQGEPQSEEQHGAPRAGRISVQKYIRVNGIPRRASDLVGQVNAVMFSAQDMELVYGSPAVRRRYLDILISQLDHRYLRALQRYQRVVYQRNHLLRMVREGSSQADELEFWDDEVAKEGGYIMAQRLRTVQRLSELACPIHLELTGDNLQMHYQPSLSTGSDGSEDALAQDLHEAIVAQRRRELAQGATVVGPHRDDIKLIIDGMDADVYASRGQSRTAVLAMRLAEACYLRDQRHHEPILLLDDVLSELDAARRARVLEAASQYQQCFITTANVESIEERFLSPMSRLALRQGQVEAVDV